MLFIDRYNICMIYVSHVFLYFTRYELWGEPGSVTAETMDANEPSGWVLFTERMNLHLRVCSARDDICCGWKGYRC